MRIVPLKKLITYLSFEEVIKLLCWSQIDVYERLFFYISFGGFQA